MTITRTYDVPALARANSLLEALANSREPLTIPDLLRQVDIPRSTVYLILDTLENLRWIKKMDGRYSIGIRLLEIGNAYIRHDNLLVRFHSEAKKFVMNYNEVVQMAVLDGLDVVYIARVDAPQPIRLVSDLGSRLPAHCSALGKVLLANLPDHALKALIPRSLKALTPFSVSTRAELFAQIEAIRRTGIAKESEEVSAGLVCFAAFVGLTAEHRRVAVSTSVPIFRLNNSTEKSLSKGIANLARIIGIDFSDSKNR